MSMEKVFFYEGLKKPWKGVAKMKISWNLTQIFINPQKNYSSPTKVLPEHIGLKRQVTER